MRITAGTLRLAICLGLLTTAAVVGITGCAGDRYQRSTGQYIDDKSIEMRVHDALGDNPEYKFDNVNVQSFRGVVQLSGFVDTADQKSTAADIAKKVQDVKSVKNNITVKSQSAGEDIDDDALTDRVKAALDDNPNYKFDGVNVVTYHGTVQLSGFVNTSEQKTKAGDVAKQVQGVKNIVNNITIKTQMD